MNSSKTRQCSVICFMPEVAVVFLGAKQKLNEHSRFHVASFPGLPLYIFG